MAPSFARSRVLIAIVLSMAVGMGVAPAGAGPPAAPSVRLLAASSSVTLRSFNGYVPLDLGVYAAATGGDFRIDVTRPDYEGPLTAAQVDPDTGDVLRPIPSEMVDWNGLRDFTTVTFRRDDNVVSEGAYTFCPNSWSRERVNDEGPASSRYPEFCQGWFPFLRGMVWGIDEHWASPALGGEDESPAVFLPRGQYDVTVEIDPAYAELFEIEEPSVELSVTIKKAQGGFEPFGAPEGSGQARPAGHVPTIEDPDPETLPDLAALPAWSIGVRNARKKRSYVTFAASPWNAGPAPLVVEGFRASDEERAMDAFQYFYDEDGSVVGRAPAGRMHYHAKKGHRHWHFVPFAQYSLLSLGNEETRRSKKQGYCLVPTDPVDLTVPRADWRPGSMELSRACGRETSLWIREVLEAGWADTYHQWVPGQAINITKVPNGWYRLRVTVNPEGVLHEASMDNNTEDRLVRLSGKAGKRRVVAAPWNSIEA